MTNFEFRLENLLELRAEAELEAAAELAVAQRAAEEACNALKAVETNRTATRERIAQLQMHGSDAGQLQALRLVLERLEDSVEAAEIDTIQAQESLGRARVTYHRANRERRALEELRTKQQEDWAREAARQDQRNMDEVAVMRHGRGNGSVTRGGEVA